MSRRDECHECWGDLGDPKPGGERTCEDCGRVYARDGHHIGMDPSGIAAPKVVLDARKLEDLTVNPMSRQYDPPRYANDGPSHPDWQGGLPPLDERDDANVRAPVYSRMVGHLGEEREMLILKALRREIEVFMERGSIERGEAAGLARCILQRLSEPF